MSDDTPAGPKLQIDWSEPSTVVSYQPGVKGLVQRLKASDGPARAVFIGAIDAYGQVSDPNFEPSKFKADAVITAAKAVKLLITIWRSRR